MLQEIRYRFEPKLVSKFSAAPAEEECWLHVYWDVLLPLISSGIKSVHSRSVLCLRWFCDLCFQNACNYSRKNIKTLVRDDEQYFVNKLLHSVELHGQLWVLA
jgi:hypothetical protein